MSRDITTNETTHDKGGDASQAAPTALPAPPLMPTFMPRIVSLAAQRPALTLVCTNATPIPSRATVPHLRVLRGRPSTPPSPPSIPPTGSTPIRRAA